MSSSPFSEHLQSDVLSEVVNAMRRPEIVFHVPAMSLDVMRKDVFLPRLRSHMHLLLEQRAALYGHRERGDDLQHYELDSIRGKIVALRMAVDILRDTVRILRHRSHGRHLWVTIYHVDLVMLVGRSVASALHPGPCTMLSTSVLRTVWGVWFRATRVITDTERSSF